MRDKKKPDRMRRFLVVLLFVSSLFLLLIFTQRRTSPTVRDAPTRSRTVAGESGDIATTIYYVDCTGGNDASSGTSPSQPWKTLKPANAATLLPGNSLLLKRGCSWTGPLKAPWQGTAAQPITIGAYGSGDLPRIQNAANNVNVTGSYLIIEYLQTRANAPALDPNCANQPYGWTAGFNFTGTAAYNILRYSKATEHTMGVHLNRDTHHNQILNNDLSNNNVMDTLTPISVSSTDDRGPWGMVIRGTDNEAAYNTFANNNAVCSYDLISVGNSIEVFEGQRNVIHHNRSFNDQQFSEVAGTPSRRASDNIWAYNQYWGSTPRMRFLVVRNAKNSFGPTWRNEAYNNTVYLTGPSSQAIVCHAGCTSDILVMKNNILWAEEKAAYADGAFPESNNIFWSSNGQPWVQFVGFTMSSTDKVANPYFVDPASGDFRLKTGSPAVDAGTVLAATGIYAQDLGAKAVPQGTVTDIGAYEYTLASAGGEGVEEETTIRHITFESGQLLDPVVGADNLVGAVTLETSAPLRGAYSARITNASDSYLDTSFTPTDELIVTFDLRLLSLPATDMRLAFITNGGNLAGVLQLKKDGTLQLRYQSTQIGSPSAAIQVGSTYQVKLRQKRGTGTNGVLEAYIIETGTLFSAPFASMTKGTWTTPANRIRLGATVSTKLNALFDDIQLNKAPIR